MSIHADAGLGVWIAVAQARAVYKVALGDRAIIDYL
jgi:hypothetical protein